MVPGRPADDERLDDENDLREAWNAYSGIILAFSRKLLTTEADAEDVTQQTFIDAWRQRARFDPARGSLPAWLMGIAKHKIADCQRRLRRVAVPADPLVQRQNDARGDPESDGMVDDFVRRALIADALAHLPNDRRRVLGLVFYEQLTHYEIATQLGLPLGTVKSHVRRGLDHLRRVLRDYDEPPRP